MGVVGVGDWGREMGVGMGELEGEGTVGEVQGVVGKEFRGADKVEGDWVWGGEI